MSNNEEHKIDIKTMWEEIRDKKPVRQGVFLGEEEEKFYVAKSEKEIYELSALVYYVWLICDGEHSVEELAQRMSKEVDVAYEEVLEPLIIALNSLSNVELVKYM